VLITHGNNIGGGNASLLETSAAANNDGLAFAAIAENSIGANNYTLAHEVGHIIGAGHERGNPDGARGPFTYSYGYRFTRREFCSNDIMSYDPGLEIPYYANPAVSYHGAPTGSPIGAPDEADLASTFAVTGPYVANYRATVVPDSTAPVAQLYELNRAGATLSFTIKYTDDSRSISPPSIRTTSPSAVPADGACPPSSSASPIRTPVARSARDLLGLCCRQPIRRQKTWSSQ